MTNGHVEADDEDRPTKKFKGKDGSAVLPDVDGANDDGMNDDDEVEVYEHQEDEEDEDEEVEVEEDDGDDQDGEEDAANSGLVDEPDPDDIRSAQPMHLDEADSDPGSDSD